MYISPSGIQRQKPGFLDTLGLGQPGREALETFEDGLVGADEPWLAGVGEVDGEERLVPALPRRVVQSGSPGVRSRLQDSSASWRRSDHRYESMVECTDDGAKRKKLNGGDEKRGHEEGCHFL
jgi:hypothetical protein